MRTLSILPVALVIASCAAHVDGNLRLNGAAYALTTCASGQTRGFSGVELADDEGSRLRLATNVDGSASVVYFPVGSSLGENLGSCASVRFEPGVGVINGARNIDGAATLSCQTEHRRIEGTVRFENCH